MTMVILIVVIISEMSKLPIIDLATCYSSRYSDFYFNPSRTLLKSKSYLF